jgi:large subunit ribosomal protein L29
MRASELRQLTTSELQQRLDEAKAELFNLRFEVEAAKLEDFSRVKLAKRDVARILTVMRERQLAEALEAEDEQA